jgi:chloramphenicol-sensitive protein RarD
MAFYFGLIRNISPLEIAVNRGLWSLPIAACIVWYLGQWGDVGKAVKKPRVLATLALTSGLIVFNWGFYVWSIEQGRTLESSLGYFINPLLNVVMGYLFLGERFTKPQLVALGLAVIAVVIQTVSAGVFPWLGLMLASTFCLYGFLRKTVAVGPTQGFLIEISFSALPLVVAELWLASKGETHFASNARDTLMLMGCGAMTSAARNGCVAGAGSAPASPKTRIFSRKATSVGMEVMPNIPATSGWSSVSTLANTASSC